MVDTDSEPVKLSVLKRSEISVSTLREGLYNISEACKTAGDEYLWRIGTSFKYFQLTKFLLFGPCIVGWLVRPTKICITKKSLS